MVHVKWEPFRDLMVMQDRMTRLFDETLSRVFKGGIPRGVWSPPVDMVEREDEVVLRVDLPGVNQNEINIKVEENMLIIHGERKFSKEDSGENYIQIERPYGSFQRTFTLPKVIEQESVKASYKDGVLQITLPKKKDIPPKQISVDTN